MPMNPRLLRPTQGGFSSPDADARAYLAAVRIADGSNLEPAVAKAISDFVIGCKADGIWSAIKASCILMGAKTLSGALTPLVGGSPTNVNNNFVSGDYNRKTGLVGNGSTKYLDSNRNNNADPQNSKHFSVYIGTLGTVNRALIGAQAGANGGTAYYQGTSGQNNTRLHNGTQDLWGTQTAGFAAVSRAAAGSYTGRSNGTTSTITRDSQAPASGNLQVFAQTGGGQASDVRLAFYSIGESLDITLLDTRVTNLYNAIGAAI